MKRAVCLWLLLLLVAAPVISYSQSTFGTLTGVITDAAGSALPGAVLVITNRRTQISHTVKSDGGGNYQAVNLDPGLYGLTVSASGFAQANREVELLARQVARVDVRMEAAATKASVDIIASNVINSETPTITDSKSGREISSLALNFRATNNPSPIVVATLAPGVQQDRGGNISVAGGQPYTTSFSLDGVSTQSVRAGGPVRDLFPSVESIAEFKVSSINNNAEFGQVSDLTVISKGGSNDYHGAAFWYHQNSALNASNPFGAVASDGKRIKPPEHTNAFGGVLSGPLTIPKVNKGGNRTFFFIDYEGVRRPQQALLNEIVPPDAFRSGDLSSIATPIINPLTGQQFANNQIPVNPTSARLLDSLYERQNRNTGASLSGPNLTTNLAGNYTVNGFDGRVDQNFGERHKFFGRYTHKDIEKVNDPGDIGAGYNTKAGDFFSRTEVRNLAGSYNAIIRNNLVNELRAGYTIANTLNGYPLAAQGGQIVRDAGLTGLPPTPTSGGLPNLNISGGFITTSPGRPRGIDNKTIQFNDNLTWIKGRHTVKTGFDFQRLSFRDILTFFAGDEFGEYFFTGAITGNAFADFLLGLPSATTYAQNGPDARPFAYHYAFFVQDDWRLTPKLTVNYGLRYELHPPFDDETKQLANFDRFFPGGRVVVQDEQGLRQVAPSFRADVKNTPIVLAKDAGLPETLRKTDKNDFNPRLGFAYRPFSDNKTVIRGGAGVYTITVLGSVLYSLAGVATSNAPVFANGATPNGFALRFPNAFPSSSAGGSGGVPDFRRANQTDLTDPYSIQWNLTVERELPWRMGLRLTYTGSKTRNLIYSPDLNQVRSNTLGYDTVKNTRPFPNFNAVLTRDNGPSAKYHAFTAEFSRRFAGGLSFQNSWTWAKNLSNAGGSAPDGFAAENGPTTLDIFDIRSDYGDVAFTRRHRFISTFVWELPVGKGRRFLNNVNHAGDLLIGGWELSAITLLQTGPYLTPTFSGADPSGTGVLSRGVTTTQRPDRIGDGNLDHPTADAYFDRNAFQKLPNNIGRFGNAGVGILRGPGTATFSMTLAKRFAITERLNLRYEASFANLFNHLNLNTPRTLNILDSSFGRITQTQTVDQAGPRTIQMSLRLSF
jgi:hypothetical protein